MSASAYATDNLEVKAFMAEASAALERDLPTPKDVFTFGDSVEHVGVNTNLLHLAIEGKKTGTTTWPVPNPQYWNVGDYSVILNAKEEPAALMLTKELKVCKFKDVPEDFALAEAEGDYKEYREGHLDFYGRRANGKDFGLESDVLVERFEIVYHRKQEGMAS